MKRTLYLVAAAVIVFLFIPVSSWAEEHFPSPHWIDRPNPLASPHAIVGGEIIIHAGPSPKSFNYYLDNNSFSAELFGAMYETLLTMNPITLDFEPGLASQWTISDDKQTFTFQINPRAEWSDGQPVTAQDVRWTWDAIMNPTNLTGPNKGLLEVFDPPVIIDDRQIRFHAKQVHWRNLSTAGGFQILPKHVFATQDFNRINFEFPVVSALYRLGRVEEGVSVTLERRTNWWNRASPSVKGVGNFQRLKFRFFEEQENAFEAFKKGEIDLYAVYTARLWVNETGGDKFDRNWIVKQKIQNYNPIGLQGFAMNMRRFPFNDLRVREALALLLNREKMNRTLMYDQYFLHRSYFEDLYSPEHPCEIPPLSFNKDRARKLLSEAGWKANPKTGLLEKEGKPFRFHFLNRGNATDKFLAIYSEDLKDVGIELVIDTKDNASWARDLDGFNFDMTWVSWSSSVFKDPEPMWSTREAGRSGNNLSGFSDPQVDALIEKQKGIFNLQERNVIYRDIDRRIASQFPYILLWNINYTRLLYWNKFGTPPTVLSKYGGETSAYWYWWYDEDSAAELKDAMQQNRALSARKPSIVFDESLKPNKP